LGKQGQYISRNISAKKARKIGSYQKSWPMRAYKNFILSSPIRRGRRPRQGQARQLRSRAYFVDKGRRHTFKKFYLKKNIIDNISRQKKQTFLMIKDDNKMIILRPLLKFSRFEFLKFCEFWSLPIIPDFTNFNVCFRRNNLRLQFIPYLKIFLNLNLFQKIDQFQQILQLENQYLQFFLKKIHGATFYGEAAGRQGRTLKYTDKGEGQQLAAQGDLARARCGEGQPCCAKGERYPPAPAKGPLPLPVAAASSITPSKPKGVQAAKSSCGKPSPSGRIGRTPLGGRRPRRRRTDYWKLPSLRANAVHGTFSLLTDPARWPFGTHVSPKSCCQYFSLFYDYRKNYFFYFPKIFQYLIIHHFYYFVRKKISFNEISCIFQKLQPQSKSK